MITDKILEIGIDEAGKLYLKPEKEKFTLIYRSATEVHWDATKMFLYSPKPREWSYLDWYKHIVSVIKTEAYCTLKITLETKWVNVPDELQQEILNSEPS